MDELTEAIRIVTLAVAEDRRRSYVAAHALYTCSLEHFARARATYDDAATLTLLDQRTDEYRRRAAKLHRYLTRRTYV